MTHTFVGTLQSKTSRESPLTVSLQFDGDRVRMWSDRHRIGSWSAEEVHVTRETIFRFLLSIDEEAYAFTPDDPAGFVSMVDVEVDLTATPRPRFGLAERIRQAANVN